MMGINPFCTASLSGSLPWSDLLADVLPVASGANATTRRQHVLRVAERAEGELGKEQSSFIDGCPAEGAGLPTPEGRIIVGLDGWPRENTQLGGAPPILRRSPSARYLTYNNAPERTATGLLKD